MIKTVDELKELILWAKAQKVKSIKLGDVIVEMSDLAFYEETADLSYQSVDLSMPPKSPRLPNGNVQANEDDEDLFYSTR